MRQPKMTDICAVCGMRYGRHALMGDSCPKRGKRWEYLPTRFKLKRKTRADSTRSNNAKG